MTTSLKPATGYSVCQEMVEAIQEEIRALKAIQRQRTRGMSMAGPVRALAMACAGLQSEIRKTGDDAERAVDNLPPERQVALILKAITDMSPEHRVAVQVYLEELGGKLL